MKNRIKSNWKLRMMLSVFIGVMVIFSAIYGVTYFYFRNRLLSTYEQITTASFYQVQVSIEAMMVNAESALNRLSNDEEMHRFALGDYRNEGERRRSHVAISNAFSQFIAVNPQVLGFGIISGDGRALGTTINRANSGQKELSPQWFEFMALSKEYEPFVHWGDHGPLHVPRASPLFPLLENPGIVGIKSLNAFGEYERDSYLFVVISEESIRNSYRNFAYNDSNIMLVNDSNRIISSNHIADIGTVFHRDDVSVGRVFSLPFYRWELVSIISDASFAAEMRTVQRFGIVAIIAAFFSMILVFFLWGRRYGKLLVKVIEQEKALEELRTLQYQINPHFLYNSLHSIRWLAMMNNNTTVADSIVTLSKIIMPILRNPSFKWTVAEELGFLDNYIKMMRIRFGSYVEYDVNCDDHLYEMPFPRFILQPIIENCFVHMSTQQDMLRIALKITRKERVEIEIINNTPMQDIERLEQVNQQLARGEKGEKSIGLYNVRKRLQLLYGAESSVKLSYYPGQGVAVSIIFDEI